MSDHFATVHCKNTRVKRPDPQLVHKLFSLHNVDLMVNYVEKLIQYHCRDLVKSTDNCNQIWENERETGEIRASAWAWRAGLSKFILENERHVSESSGIATQREIGDQMFQLCCQIFQEWKTMMKIRKLTKEYQEKIKICSPWRVWNRHWTQNPRLRFFFL